MPSLVFLIKIGDESTVVFRNWAFFNKIWVETREHLFFRITLRGRWWITRGLKSISRGPDSTRIYRHYSRGFHEKFEKKLKKMTWDHRVFENGRFLTKKRAWEHCIFDRMDFFWQNIGMIAAIFSWKFRKKGHSVDFYGP